MEGELSPKSLAVEKSGQKRNSEPITPKQTPGTSGQCEEREEMSGESSPKKETKVLGTEVPRVKQEYDDDCGAEVCRQPSIPETDVWPINPTSNKRIDRRLCENPFECGHCGIWFPQFSKMMTHMKIHEKLHCKKCYQTFEHLGTLNRHMKREDKCEHCCEEFRDPNDLKEHIQKWHGVKDTSADIQIM